MTALETAQTTRSANYAAIQAFIAEPEPNANLPDILSRLVAVENWILAKELEV